MSGPQNLGSELGSQVMSLVGGGSKAIGVCRKGVRGIAFVGRIVQKHEDVGRK